MTKKHFAAIAHMLKVQLAQDDLTDDSRDIIARIARNLAFEFSQINGAFRFDAFYAACGLLPDGYTADAITDALANRIETR